MGSGKRKEWKLSLSPKPFTHTTLVSTIQNSQPSHTFDKENTNKQKFLKGCLILQAWIFHTKTWPYLDKAFAEAIWMSSKQNLVISCWDFSKCHMGEETNNWGLIVKFMYHFFTKLWAHGSRKKGRPPDFTIFSTKKVYGERISNTIENWKQGKVWVINYNRTVTFMKNCTCPVCTNSGKRSENW